MFSSIGPSDSYDCGEPPGMIDGPFSAPSSPPDTPMPTKWMPASRRAASRRRVSMKCALPPSMIMSSCSRSGANSSITASVAAPAFTMMTRRRGRSRLATNSCAVRAGTNVPSWPNSSMMASVLAVVRLCRAVA